MKVSIENLLLFLTFLHPRGSSSLAFTCLYCLAAIQIPVPGTLEKASGRKETFGIYLTPLKLFTALSPSPRADSMSLGPRIFFSSSGHLSQERRAQHTTDTMATAIQQMGQVMGCSPAVRQIWRAQLAFPQLSSHPP